MPQLLEVCDLTSRTGYINAACIGRAYEVDDRQVRAALKLPPRLAFLNHDEEAVKNFPQGDPIANAILAEDVTYDEDEDSELNDEARRIMDEARRIINEPRRIISVNTTYEPILAIEMTHHNGLPMFIIATMHDLSRALRRAMVNPKKPIISVTSSQDEADEDEFEDATR